MTMRSEPKSRVVRYMQRGMIIGLLAGISVSALLFWTAHYFGLSWTFNPFNFDPLAFYLAGLANAVVLVCAFIALGGVAGQKLHLRRKLKEMDKAAHGRGARAASEPARSLNDH
ncbi:MAG TPA: hypothetical protein VN541_03770 [Tepidisphaeraceae bacterium]|nr:hypothetical protein [Tepidisphaeraceae bacterium]